jgi:hypothetical protein
MSFDEFYEKENLDGQKYQQAYWWVHLSCAKWILFDKEILDVVADIEGKAILPP